MTLPELTLPKIELPFDVAPLLHPFVDHFAIALPIVIILLEFYNLFARKKSVGGFSFILIILTVVAFAAAYFTGLVDGKETYDILSAEGKEALKEHKLLGTYLLIGSGVLLFFKLLAMTGKGFFKFLFFAVLIGFVVVTLEQGKEGGELTYQHGANIERVKTLDDTLFDTKEELEEAQEELKASKVSAKVPAQTPAQIPAKVPVVETSSKVELPIDSKEELEEAQEELKASKVSAKVPAQTPAKVELPKTNLDEDKLLNGVKEKIQEVITQASEKAPSSDKKVVEEMIEMRQ